MKYIKKPIVIEAIQLKVDNFDIVCDFMGGTPVPKHNPNFGVDEHGNTNEPYLGVYIETPEGRMLANYGDHIVKDENGRFFVCKPYNLEGTYMIADTFKDRLVIEQQDLSDKLLKLSLFVDSPKFKEEVPELNQRVSLLNQRESMSAYLHILNERIKTL